MKDTTLSASLHLPSVALLFDLNALYACLQTIPDHRDRRGVRYPRAAPAHGRGACQMSRTRWFSWDGTLGQTANQGIK